MKNKPIDHFSLALIVILLSVSISAIAFITENKEITGFATLSQGSGDAINPDLREFDNLDSLRTLSKGNYYIDGNGIVYWLDDDSRPAIAKVTFIRDVSKDRRIYIDGNGNIGYVLS